MAIEEIPPSSTKYEMRDYAREEFERHRNVTDLVSCERRTRMVFDVGVNWLLIATYTVSAFGMWSSFMVWQILWYLTFGRLDKPSLTL